MTRKARVQRDRDRAVHARKMANLRRHYLWADTRYMSQGRASWAELMYGVPFVWGIPPYVRRSA